MKLRAALSLQQVGDIKQIAEAVAGDEAKALNRPALMDLLCTRLASPTTIEGQLKGLDSEGRQVVQRLAQEGGELPYSVALKDLGRGFSHRFDDLLGVLTLAGLVYRDPESLSKDDPLVGIPETILRSIPGVEENDRLRSIMSTFALSQLRSFAEDLGIDPIPSKKAFLIEAIRDVLTDPDSLKDFVRSLPDDQRILLNHCLSHDTLTVSEIRDALTEGALRSLYELIWKTPLFVRPSSSRLTNDDEIRLAADLRASLGKMAKGQGGNLEGSPEQGLAEAIEVPDETVTPGELVPQDLTTLLGLIERRRPRTLKHGGMPKGELKEAGRFFKADGDPGYPDFLMLFAEDVGLVKNKANRWIVNYRKMGMLEDRAKLTAALLKFWKTTDRWNEWAADRTATSPKKTRTDEMLVLRKEVLTALGKCPLGQWIAYPQFYKMLHRISTPFRELAEGPASGKALASRGTTADEILRRMMSSTLAWVGLVEIGNPNAFNRPLHTVDGACFRLTPVGAHIVDKKNAPEPEFAIPFDKEATFIIQPNLEILAPPELPPADYVRLCGVSDLNSIDVVSHFQITKEAFLDAFNRSSTARTIRKFLESRSATGVPDMVKSLIKECEDKHGEIRIKQASGYLEVDDTAMMDELLAQKQVAEVIDERLSDCVASIKATVKPDTVANTLSKLGYMPALETHGEETEDGVIQLNYRGSDLSRIVGFLEASQTFLGNYGDGDSGPTTLIRQLKRSLRRSPGEPLEKAKAKYTDAFESAIKQIRESDGRAVKNAYQGNTPASKAKDIRKLIDYAIENRMRIKLGYGDRNHQGRVVEPTSEDDQMLYAYCRSRKGDRVFRVDRIVQAELTDEVF
ncbi:MAG: hypothetical protein CME19_09020 [Gemmatimonadetes bacterium]|nr:hypothetical protein [Gemmatimonadota bacterium]